jgi:ribonuclease HII
MLEGWMVLICGVDDAGRGPVIGPMVIAGVAIDEKDIEKLREIGVTDSKLLSPVQRERMFDQIQEIAKYKVVIASAAKIDEAVESETTNLNWLESEMFAEAINYLKPSRAIVDCPSTNIEAYSAHLRTYLNVKVHLNCLHKADLKYEVAGAASILAKVTRDREIAKLKEKYGDFGSGYPSDPRTKKFLLENWEKYPELFRKSWATYKKVAIVKNQSSLGDF